MQMNPDIDWMYSADPGEKAGLGLNGRRVPVPRGKMLGGSSSINYMMYVRGHPGGGIAVPLNEIVAQFEQTSGHKVTIRYGTAPQLIELAKTTPFDCAVTPSEVFQDEGAAERLVPGPTANVAHVGLGVAVRANLQPVLKKCRRHRNRSLDLRPLCLWIAAIRWQLYSAVQHNIVPRNNRCGQRPRAQVNRQRSLLILDCRQHRQTHR